MEQLSLTGPPSPLPLAPAAPSAPEQPAAVQLGLAVDVPVAVKAPRWGGTALQPTL